MTKRERIQAVIRREPTDRPPYALWRHFPAVDRSPAGLAQSILRFQDRYGPDLLKITPARGHAVADWGGEEADEHGPDGARPIARHAIQAPEDWKRVRPVELGSNGWGAQLEVVIRIVIDRRADGPVLPTLSSALSVARALAGHRLDQDLRAHPQAVADALEVITEMNLRLAEACGDEGAEGIFYVIDAGAGPLPDPDHYRRFAEPHDRRVLEAARRRGAITVLHTEGAPPALEGLATLPADLWSGDDGRGESSIREQLTRVPGAVIGGLDAATLRCGTAAEVKAQAQDAIAQSGGLGLVLGPGSGLLLDTPDASLVELARSLEGQVRLGLIKPQG